MELGTIVIDFGAINANSGAILPHFSAIIHNSGAITLEFIIIRSYKKFFSKF